MKNQFVCIAYAGLLALSSWGCKTPDAQPLPYEEGVYMVNQGNFSQNNGTISFLPRGANTVTTDIFRAANGRPLGGILQDYTEVNGKGVILVDNSAAGLDKVEIVEISTFKSRATLGAPDIENPRRVVGVGPNRAYVSCWDVSGSYSAGTYYKDPGYVAVVDLNTNTVTKKISAIKAAQNMVVAGSEAFVGSDPGYAPNTGANTLLVIDLTTDEVKQRIDFSAPPQPLALDAGGRLWLLVGADLIRMNVPSRAIERRLTLPATPDAVAVSSDKQAFYYVVTGRTYRFGINDAGLPTSSLINRRFAALGVDPQSGTLYASQYPVFYDRANYVLRYQSNGQLIDSVRAEIAPSGFFFR